jgi:hypothetical protein
MVRSAAQRRVSNHGSARPSFETRAREGALLRMREEAGIRKLAVRFTIA